VVGASLKERIRSMSSVSNRQLKGNFAENIVAEWLSRVCLVRSVTTGTDIGIDLYCEALVENNPYLHFWVQVKAITNRDISMKNGIKFASYRFKRSHLEYWARQPIPVYAFLVPVNDWPPKYPERVYGIAITRYIIESGIPESKTVKLETAECTEFATIDNDWNKFISEIVPADTAILLFSKGIVSEINFVGSSQKHFPRGFALKYAEKILDAVRDSVIVLGSETLENVQDEFRGFRHICELIASLYIPRISDLGINFLVESALKDGKIQKALDYINSVQREIMLRTDVDQAKKAEYVAKLEVLRQKTNL
jgi:hypothetical protein